MSLKRKADDKEDGETTQTVGAAQIQDQFHTAIEMKYGAYQNIYQCPIDVLYPHPRNYQDHPPDQLAEIRTSLREFGQTKPALAWPRSLSEYADPEDNAGYFMIGGHGLREAALLEGWSTLWVRVLPENMPESMVVAYIGIDNETARGAEVNLDKLAMIVRRTERELGSTLAQATAGGKEALDSLKAMGGGADESLADLLARFGDPREDDFWPFVRLKVPPDLLGRFNHLMRQAPGETEWEKLQALLEQVPDTVFSEYDEDDLEGEPGE